MKYLLTGGGTGGHVYPALAIKELIKKDDPKADFLYIGTPGKAEEYILQNLKESEKIPLLFIHACGLPRTKNILRLLRFFKDLTIGYFESLKIIREFQPDLVIATGGYVSAPVILAARFTGKKIILQEQNSVPGLVNKALCRFARKVLVTFPETVSAFPPGKASAVGYPIRRKIAASSKEEARKSLGLPIDSKVVFVFGGSSGARVINESIVRNLDLLLSVENVVIIHGTGRDNPDGNRPYTFTKSLLENLFPSYGEERYILSDYFHSIDTVYCSADLVVSRAGAGTIMECASLGIPMVLIPKSGLPGNHQELNARSVVEAGGGAMIKEESFQNQVTVDGEKLVGTIRDIVNNTTKLIEMGKNIKKVYTENANELIIESIREVLNA